MRVPGYPDVVVAELLLGGGAVHVPELGGTDHAKAEVEPADGSAAAAAAAAGVAAVAAGVAAAAGGGRLLALAAVQHFRLLGKLFFVTSLHYSLFGATHLSFPFAH